ncbi:MAG: hypothetical protein ABFC88_13075 [Thermoguttaceae bacterium]
MSKKHFIALAAEISAIVNPKARRAAALAVCSACARFNGRFDRGRFLRACGVNAD